MTLREKTLAVLRRQATGFMPFEFGLCPSLNDEFKQRTGSDSYTEYYNFPYQNVVAKHNGKSNFERYFDDLEGLNIDPMWGIGRRKGSVAHFTHTEYPMKKFTTMEEFESYPYPDIGLFDWEGCAKTIEYIHQVKGRASMAHMACTIFETAWGMRGMEEFMMDMLTEPELAEYHMDRITAIRIVCARQYALAGADILHLGDDVATQRNMMMSPKLWRTYLKPRLKKVIDAAKEVRPDIIIDYHSDGNVTDIVPELIEIGIEVLNPVQPECMNVDQMVHNYGDVLSFRGCIGTQTTMPFGSKEDVKREVEHLISLSEKQGGIIAGPSHMLEPEVPFENIEMYIQTIKDYNNQNKFKMKKE
jgi:uroporphyrinogen decarboxylase